MKQPAKPAKSKRGHHRLVIGKSVDGTAVTFVDTNVGGFHTLSVEGGEAIATTHARTYEPAAKRSHKYSALGRAR